MAGEGEDEAAAIEQQLEQHLQEQRSSLAAVDEALAADPSNADLLEVHEELLAAIKDAEEGLLDLKHSRLMKQIDDIFPTEEPASQAPEVAAEPLDPDDVEPEPLVSHDFSVGSKCRFRHNNGRWYNGCIIGFEGSSDMCKFFLQQRCRFGSNCRMSHGIVIPTSALKRFTPTRWQQSLVGSSILAASGHHSGLWRRAELESWDDNLKVGQVVFQDDGSSARLPSDSLFVSEYAGMSNEDDEGSSSEEESEFSDDADQEDGCVHQGLGLSEPTNFSGIQTDTVIFAKWEHHTRGVASKMMAKMGYREGMGLGVSGQGMLDPIPVKVLPPKQSLEYALAASEADGSVGSGKKRSRGGKRKREKKFAEQARAAKAEEAERSVFSFINSHLVTQDVPEGSAVKVKKGPSGEANGHAKEEDRRSLVAYDEEVKELRIQVEKLEEMKIRNRKDKAVFEAASRKLEETRKALADAEATHASATNAIARKEKEKKWLKF
ncbi:Zinc finger CCCH domain-containing protein 18 [Dichanthelium oligosanthes]|uniref:Zinc finger CCCH domain-containing protein 18 n=1 Tax=Dichanthelium oligosanthes TaxID=888268 RepID=A0A1E5VZZ8_9POAL|nr:Zinc finger CCCH domain-containing protein 18 [Dichanthelium oligosanthes]